MKQATIKRNHSCSASDSAVYSYACLRSTVCRAICLVCRLVCTLFKPFDRFGCHLTCGVQRHTVLDDANEELRGLATAISLFTKSLGFFGSIVTSHSSTPSNVRCACCRVVVTSDEKNCVFILLFLR